MRLDNGLSKFAQLQCVSEVAFRKQLKLNIVNQGLSTVLFREAMINLDGIVSAVNR